MTIGIGVLCQSGQVVVMAADSRGTYEDAPQVGNHESLGKQYDLPLNLCVNIAGAVNLCNSLVAGIGQEITDLTEKQPPIEIFHDHIRHAIRDAQVKEISFAMDYALLQNLGMGLKEWKDQWPTSPRIHRAGRAVFRLLPFNVELSVGGFLLDSPVLLTALGREPVEVSHSISVIGSGWEEATAVLNSRGQATHTSLSATVVHVHEAMQAARKQKTVGNETDYVVITPKNFRRLPAAFAKELAARWSGRDTDPLEDDEDTFKEVVGALYLPGTTRQEYAAGRRSPTASTRSASRKSTD